MRALACLLLLASLGLAGCSTTVFESLPVGTTTDCDPAWPGRWQPVGGGNEAMQPKDALEFSADCRTATVKGEAKPVRLTLIDTGKARYLQLHNDSGEPDCIGEGKSHCGYALLRYEREGDVIRVYEPDHARIAASIKSGAIKGFSETTAQEVTKTGHEPIYRNFVAGNDERIAKLLGGNPEFFAIEPLMVLQRVPVDTAPAPAGGQ